LLLLLLQGGFQQEMSRREAALILGLRESAAEERIKEAHRRIMIANHPDSGNDNATGYSTVTASGCIECCP
jgi:curved DNA-binding protein CbpA